MAKCGGGKKKQTAPAPKKVERKKEVNANGLQTN